MPRDLNDARVEFTTWCTSRGLTLEDAKELWRIVVPPAIEAGKRKAST